ncbi:xanthine dehydrogenase family protein subunit M [Paucibacter sp. R3-3]|uniref:Xanthine dehydrogenase family protein subunit M n=1 Tax=Roseateles agri TaxID=3098619 RepID=A0ABU5DMR2_9BURK|nr:xanthine dehydrogenase family protein subunit M [Paucibacter sp. R3-3]MDY0747591.1 xanthine dehydrogenase family protein subunit M [Paucibacter sp. R3-3]
MYPFSYVRADDALGAIQASRAGSAFLAGGTSLVDCLKLDAVRADALIDINGLQRSHGEIALQADGLQLGSLVRMAQLAAHPGVNRDYPLLAQTMRFAASAQLRNMASLGGNVLQRTRCPYFRDTSWAACNRRVPGSGCAALEGENRRHAVLGTSERCIAAYPGDFAQALVALDARVQLMGTAGARVLRFEELHRGPEAPERETVLQPGELITGFFVPAGPWTRRSLYLKVRDRASYEFALASAAVALDLAPDGMVRNARIALGGVAYRPWRAHTAEAWLQGKRLDEQSAAETGRAAMQGAQARRGNAFKVELGARTVARALIEASRLEI